MAIDYAFASAGPVTAADVRLCWIRNTATLDRMFVSTALLAEVAAHPGLGATPGVFTMKFDADGELLPPTRD
jgi:hypothetical protein